MTTLRKAASVALLLLIAAAANTPAFAATCAADATTLCLNNGRFKVDVQWKDFQGGTGVGQAVPITSDTGYFWFFSSNNVELVVKVLDARAFNNYFWVFFGALSNVEYTMTVTDTETGRVKTYFNRSGQFASVGDTAAFFASGTRPPALRSASAGTRVEINESATCGPTDTSLCLNRGRFRLEVNWSDFSGGSGVGKAVSLTSDTGYFWFFNSANVELIVKVLDARALNGRFWVFYGALSNVEYEIKVTDTVTGNVETYSNPSGRFASTGDTTGFPAGYGVTARLDESRAVSADIPATGGTMTATAADGSVFTLSVPSGALFSEEKITMTPVTAIDGLPLTGGLAAAVDLGPAGLRLSESATLTITPVVPVPIAEEITFAWRGSGEEFFFYPPELGTSNVSMKVLHFSGYGVGRGSAADQTAQERRVPASSEDALEQSLQALVANRRKAQSAGVGTAGASDPDFYTEYEVRLRRYYDDHLAGKLEAARDCDAAKKIMTDIDSWSKQVTGIGMDDIFEPEILHLDAALIDLLARCYDQAFDKCVVMKDPPQVREMLQIMKQLTGLGADGRVDSAKIFRCANFELEFESDIEETPPVFGLSWRHNVRANVPLELKLPDELIGDSDLLYGVTYNGPSVSPCSYTLSGTNSRFEVVRAVINLNRLQANAPPRDPLRMVYLPGEPKMIFTLNCPTVSPLVVEELKWSEYYSFLHNSEMLAESAFTASDWARGGGDLYATRSYWRTTPEAEEITTFILKHRPE